MAMMRHALQPAELRCVETGSFSPGPRIAMTATTPITTGAVASAKRRAGCYRIEFVDDGVSGTAEACPSGQDVYCVETAASSAEIASAACDVCTGNACSAQPICDELQDRVYWDGEFDGQFAYTAEFFCGGSGVSWEYGDIATVTGYPSLMGTFLAEL